MFRALFIFLSKAFWAQKLIMNWKFAWHVASRFIAGINIIDAIKVIKNLNDQGLNVTVDHLGENAITVEDTLAATKEVIDLLEAINSQEVQANVSIKLTQLGLNIDKDLCKSNLQNIIEHAKKMQNFVRIDMEDSSITQETLDVVYWLKQTYSGVGTVIQSYLYRSEKDVVNLTNECIPIRMVKGAYKEPAQVAFPKKNDVDDNFDHLTKICLDKIRCCNYPEISNDGRFPPLIAIASHDELRIENAIHYANTKDLSQKTYEIQMLYGIRRDLQKKYSEQGYPVRVYVPYGTHWYPYFMRRLAERPANVWFFFSNFFRK
ncbi:MAG: proline dehydrogenase [Chloroflexi bacterium HGW-Chloroflexi-3]|nr:MAG: proline dehydrogenase [Chloroflexi bacterium HGW-Chloroflexi-3]